MKNVKNGKFIILQGIIKDSHKHLQSTSVHEFENRSVEFIEEYEFLKESALNEGVYTSNFADKNKHSLITETTSCNSDNEVDKENINGRKSNQLLAKKRKTISPVPSHTTLAPNSLSGMSAQMLHVQEEKFVLKKQELQTKRDMLAVQQEILQELRNMNSNLQVLFENLFSSGET